MKLLLDEHIALAVARGLQGQQCEGVALRDWQMEAYLEAADEVILEAAQEDGWTLVTYDLRTIPILLKAWGEQGKVHGGIIFVDQHTSAPNDIGGLVRSLQRLIAELGDADWVSRVVYLTR